MKKYAILLLMIPFVAFSQSETNNSFDFWLLKASNDFVKEDLKNPNNFPYMKSLQVAIKNIMDKDTILNYEIFLKAIPKTESEFSIYFACDYEEDKAIRTAWGKLDQMLFKNAIKDSNVFISYLRLSEFVDGYYAESYFDNIEYLIEIHTTVFCSTYSSLSNECQRKLGDFHESSCE